MFVDQKSLSLSTLQIDCLNWDDSVRTTERETFLTQSTFVVKDSTKMESVFGNRENESSTRNSVHLTIHTTPKINVLNATIEIRICVSDVDRRITGS